MTLDEYLREKRITSVEFAELSGIGHKQTVHNYRKGIRFPTPENLTLIERATQGAVTANDFAAQHAKLREAEAVAEAQAA